MIHYITTTGIGNAWVANELRIVKSNNIQFVVHSLHRARSAYHLNEWAQEIREKTRAIYPISPWALLASAILAPLIFKRRYLAALANALFGERESLRVRIRCFCHFLVACHWAHRLRSETVSHIHAQWVHSSGTVGMYGAWLLGATFSFTGHGSDVFQYQYAFKDKIRRADFIICISAFHREYYTKFGARDDQLYIAYCGIDVEHFTPRPRLKTTDERIRIISSGRLVEKKGFRYLIDACKILLDKGVKFECVIAGSGPLERSLRRQINELGLNEVVKLTGTAILQEEIPEFMRKGDIYCLPSVLARDGDMDGLPQMLMEAMACETPVISTRLAGIPELVIHNETGMLVEPNDSMQLAEAIQSLMADPEKRGRLSRAGREYVIEKFNISTSLRPLIQLFKAKLK